MIRLRETNRNVPYFVLPKYGTGVISSKIKHFQCHSLPDGIFQLINLVDRRQDEVRTVIAAVLLVRVNKINAKYLPQKYRMEETSILIYFVVKW
jgi:hypothetical protein